MSVRQPEAREVLLREVAMLRRALGDVEEVALGDAVEEVWHLLDPAFSGEPGVVLADATELSLGADLRRALEQATWPAGPMARATDAALSHVVETADAFLLHHAG